MADGRGRARRRGPVGRAVGLVLRRPVPPVAAAPVVAWQLVEGDVLAGGRIVVSVQRNPAADEVQYGTDDGARTVTARDAPVPVARRAPGTG